MILQFTLSMPNIGSWNGKWTGSENLYAKVINFGKSKKAKEILEHGHYYYDFGDGWTARIDVAQIDAARARKVRRASNGFCGYEWMIESIRYYGDIYTDEQRKEIAKANLVA